MGVKVDIDMAEVRRYLEEEIRKHTYRLIASLQKVGQTVVDEIRTSHISDWTDRTGNLRSSIGYIIAVDGQPINMSAFEVVDGPDRDKTTENGSQIGKDYAWNLCALHPRGIALIIVAGMEYASYVEAMDNKTVLAQGEIEAKTLVNDMIQQLNQRYSK